MKISIFLLNHTNLFYIMRLLQKNKPVIRFLLTFFGSYLILAFLYNLYLNNASSQKYYPEFITHIVALQSQDLIEAFGYETKSIPSDYDPSMRIAVNGDYVVRIVEGCNAISVMVLFLAFILAFKKDWKSTVLYIFAGLVIIYALNILRIALLTIAIYEYREYTDFLHTTLFPAFIYGVVFILVYLGS